MEVSIILDVEQATAVSHAAACSASHLAQFACKNFLKGEPTQDAIGCLMETLHEAHMLRGTADYILKQCAPMKHTPDELKQAKVEPIGWIPDRLRTHDQLNPGRILNKHVITPE